MMKNVMHTQAGFTLFELMIAIVVIAILTAIGLPAYQGYVKKAALTDMLQTMTPYKTSIELCVLEKGGLTSCNTGSNGVPVSRTTQYVTSVNVAAGVITLTGQNALAGLVTTLTPTVDATQGHLNWSRTCTVTPADTSLTAACEDIFKFK
ncbi:prepilin peptidase-dependent pilin [Orbaceae bacterium ESL0727]|nr:prepilin peptidase-dependent pilin [Orbaceae bacterium ESL0727]